MLKLEPRVRLEPLGIQHAANMCRWMSDPALAADVGLRQKASPERTVEWLQKALQDASVRAFAIYAVEQHVGNVVLDQIDRYLGSARLSIYIGEAGFRGKGVGGTAVYLAAKAGFEKEGLNKVWLTVHVKNHRAINAYSRLGFALEGILREEFWLEGELISVLRMSLLKRELAQIAVA